MSNSYMNLTLKHGSQLGVC